MIAVQRTTAPRAAPLAASSRRAPVGIRLAGLGRPAAAAVARRVPVPRAACGVALSPLSTERFAISPRVAPSTRTVVGGLAPLPARRPASAPSRRGVARAGPVAPPPSGLEGMPTNELPILLMQSASIFIQAYLVLLFIRVLLSWFPTFDKWDRQPWLALRQVTDPYLRLFSGFVPPIMGAVDITPMLGFLLLQYVGGLLGGASGGSARLE